MRVNIHHFIVSSVLAHVAVFAAWTSTASRPIMIPASQSSAPVLQISFQAGKNRIVHKHLVQHTPHRQLSRLSRKATPQPKPVRTRHTPKPVKPVAHFSHPPVSRLHPAYQAKLHRNEIRNRVLTRIRTDLRQYFVYPLLAQRRGWQGRVVLAFSVEANGTIQNIRVASGSGYPILDTSAKTALSHVHQLFDDGAQLGGESMHLQLPVIFEIKGG